MRLKLLFILAMLAATTVFVACEKEDEDDMEEASGICAESYVHIDDAQLDAFCGAAYAYRCLDEKPLSNQQVQAVCAQYDDMKEPGVPACGYCQ